MGGGGHGLTLGGDHDQGHGLNGLPQHCRAAESGERAHTMVDGATIGGVGVSHSRSVVGWPA